MTVGATVTVFNHFPLFQYHTTPLHFSTDLYNCTCLWYGTVCSTVQIQLIVSTTLRITCTLVHTTKFYYWSNPKNQNPSRPKRKKRFSNVALSWFKSIPALTTSYWQLVPLVPFSSVFCIFNMVLLYWPFPHNCTIIQVCGMLLYALQYKWSWQ